MSKREDFIAGLREMADFFEANPSLQTPYAVIANVFADTKEELAAVARSGGSWQKDSSSAFFYLKRSFGGESQPVRLDVNIDREKMCRRVVTGTHIEPAKPAEPERVVEDYEWVCDERVLAGARDV